MMLEVQVSETNQVRYNTSQICPLYGNELALRVDNDDVGMQLMIILINQQIFYD